MPRKTIKLLKRARVELQKARNLLFNLKELPRGSVKRYIRFLLSAMNLVGKVLIEQEKKMGSDFSDLDKALLERHEIEKELYDLYFYLKNMLYKETERRGEQIEVKTWKSSETLTKQDLKGFYKEVDKFIEKVESKVSSRP